MQFFIAAAALFAGALAVPTSGSGQVCPGGLFSNANCCSADVLGIVGLDCNVPTETPRDGRDLQNICAKTGKEALCCVAPVADQALLCQKPVGAQ